MERTEDQPAVRPILRQMLNDTMSLAHNAGILQGKAIELLGRDNDATVQISSALQRLMEAEELIASELAASNRQAGLTVLS